MSSWKVPYARVAVPREDASANPISCFNNKHFGPGAMQFTGGGQAGRSRTDNNDIRVSHQDFRSKCPRMGQSKLIVVSLSQGVQRYAPRTLAFQALQPARPRRRVSN
jgi:hypothetical protein